MASALFQQNVIALVWDFDKTLIRGYMQAPLFRRYGVDEGQFWREVEGLPSHYAAQGLDRVSKDTMYLNHLLSYARAGVFEGLSNAGLRELGAELEFFPGLPECFARLQRFVEGNPNWRPYELKLEHYIVSTGLRQIILGSAIAPFVEDVWANEFVQDSPGPGYLDQPFEATGSQISALGYVIDNTTKTRAVFEINKGVNKEPTIDVNSYIDEDDRRVPFRNMVYIADGPSDVPCFSIVRKGGGKTLAVFERGKLAEYEQVKRLHDQHRVNYFVEADYRQDSDADLWLHSTVSELAEAIVERRKRDLDDKVGNPPRHLSGDG